MIPEIPLNVKDKTIVVGLSGGVDSTVAALLLQKAGAHVCAVFMKNWADNDDAAGCHDKHDLIAAAAAAEALRLPFAVANFAEVYKKQVFAPFLCELAAGRTPNPDVLCNSEIKFRVFCDYARARGADAVATGHYARAAMTSEGWRLFRAEDSAKDQSYFLHRLTESRLATVLFPIGGLHKADVRRLAREAGLANWRRRDSTGICFIGERDFDDFIARYLPEQPGDMQDENGRVVGRHRGLQFYTIGQRRGLGIGGTRGAAAGEAWFVAEKQVDGNILQVVRGDNHPKLFCRGLTLGDARWVAGAPPPTRWVYAARLRHRHAPAACVLTEAEGEFATVRFAEPQRAAAPGQYAVLYDGDVCLGGGVIENTLA